MISTEADNKPVRTWQHDALAELIDMVANILANRYENPEDLAGEMQTRATAIATVLSAEPAEYMPQILDAVGVHIMALDFAANEISMHSREPRDQVVPRLHYAAWERYQAMPPEDLETMLERSLIDLDRYRNPSISTASPTDGRSQTA